MTKRDKQAQTPGVGPDLRLSGRVALVYWLYIAGLLLPIFMLAGIIIAYASRGTAAPAEASHYLFQIRSFWIWLLVAFVGMALRIVGLGWIILIALWIWMLVRCVWGLRLAGAKKSHPRPMTVGWS